MAAALLENFDHSFQETPEETFLIEYQNLPAMRKKIFQWLHNHANFYTVSRASQTTIAKACGCTREYVNKSVAFFKKKEWLILISRGYRLPKRVILNKIAKECPISKKGTFHRESSHRSSHDSLPPPLRVDTSKQTGSHEQGKVKTTRLKSPRKPLRIAEHVKNLQCSIKNKLKCSLVSEFAFQEALSSAKFMFAKGAVIRDQEAYVTATAIKIALKRGEKLDWRAYYVALDELAA